MRSRQEVRDMLARFDEAAGEDGIDLDASQEAIRDTLLWVLGDVDDFTVEDYLPEEED